MYANLVNFAFTTRSLAFKGCSRLEYVQVWLAPVPIQSCVGAIANRGQWEQECSLFMATDLGPVRATRKKKKNRKTEKKNFAFI